MIRPSPSPLRQLSALHRARTLAAFWLVAACLATTLTAQTGTPQLADQEIRRRATLITTQQQRLAEAAALFKAKKTAEALKLYQEAFTALPNVPMAAQVRATALDGYLSAGTTRAKELMDAGDYPAAKAILDTLDSPNVDRGNQDVAKLRARMADPDRYPPALTPQHISNVAEVQRLLILANSQREIGNYDKALVTYEDVLRLDPHNSAARRGMETAEQERTRYFEAARDHQRSRMLNGVTALWEDTLKPSSTNISGLFGGSSAPPLQPGSTRGGREAITARLRDLKIERIDFSGASIEEVIEYLRVRSRDLDPGGRGVDFVLSLPADQPTRTISLNLQNVPVEEVLRYVTEMAGVGYRIEEYAVRIVSLTEGTSNIISKTYRVPPDFISSAPLVPAAGAAAPADPFAPQANAGVGGNILVQRLGAKEFLESRGVTFPPGTGASYSSASNMLIVRNNARNLEIVDMLVEQALNSSPKLAVISVKIIEISQDNLKELSFDSLMESFGGNVEIAGGEQGNQQTGNFLTTDFPRQVVTAGGATTALGISPITAGLRSSGDLIANRTIDDILVGSTTPASRRSPGIFSLSGVLTNPQFQTVVRALDQKGGYDVMAKPEIVTKSGQKATVQVVRELIYPTEFDPPQIPTSFGTSNVIVIINGVVQPNQAPPAVVTPATPTAFETRRVGIILDVEPVISEDGRTVDLTLTPDFTDFVGFVNYGSPINTVDPNGGTAIELTPNQIYQPIFSTRKIVTGVKVYDGATVVLGGLVTDNTIMIEDKIPIFGDIPFFGRAFRSKVSQRRVKNLLFFVSVKVVDPSGARVNPQ